jgi:hypothetical protein
LTASDFSPNGAKDASKYAPTTYPLDIVLGSGNY